MVCAVAPAAPPAAAGDPARSAQNPSLVSGLRPGGEEQNAALHGRFQQVKSYSCMHATVLHRSLPFTLH